MNIWQIERHPMKTTSSSTLALLAIFLVAFYGQAQADDASLPVHRLSASCSYYINEDGVPLIAENEVLRLELESSVVDFVQFAKDHQGQATYVEFSIQASNSAGLCLMFDDHLASDLPPGKTLGSLDRSYGFNEIEQGKADDETTYRLWARTAEHNAGTTSIILPHPSEIPSDGLFVTRRFGDFYYFSGPVILGFSEGNGFESAVLQPIGNSQFFWKEISEIGRR